MMRDVDKRMVDDVVQQTGMKRCPRCRETKWTYVWATEDKPSGLRCLLCGLVIRWTSPYSYTTVKPRVIVEDPQGES